MSYQILHSVNGQIRLLPLYQQLVNQYQAEGLSEPLIERIRNPEREDAIVTSRFAADLLARKIKRPRHRPKKPPCFLEPEVEGMRFHYEFWFSLYRAWGMVGAREMALRAVAKRYHIKNKHGEYSIDKVDKLLYPRRNK